MRNIRKPLSLILLLLFVWAFFSASVANAASLRLFTKDTSVKVGQEIVVEVLLDGREPTMGTDLTVLYSKDVLSGMEVVSGNLYPVYNPSKDKRVDNTVGKITLSGSANMAQPVLASGLFATIKFVALSPGETILKVDYQKGSTAKSGVIDFSGNELLTGQPDSLKISVRDYSFWEKLINFFIRLKESLYVMISNTKSL